MSKARLVAVCLPMVLAGSVPTLLAQGAARKAVTETKTSAPEMKQLFGVHAYAISRKGRVLTVDLFRNDRKRQGTYTLDETKAPYEREERLTLGAKTFTSRYRNDGEQTSIEVRDDEEEATITLDKDAREWSGDTETAVRITKRHANLIEAIQKDLDIHPGAPSDPKHWSKDRVVGVRPEAKACGTSRPETIAKGEAPRENAMEPRIVCAGIYFCSGGAEGATRSRACYYAQSDVQYCCTNGACWGCCQMLPCDCLCAMDDFLCTCAVRGDSCQWGWETY